MPTSRQRSDAIYFMVLGFMVSLLLGIGPTISSPSRMRDFQVIYYGDRCIIHHTDPYRYGAATEEYERDGHQVPTNQTELRVFQGAMAWAVYPPSAMLFVLPLALLSFGAAEILWMALLLIGFAIAFFLTWDLASEFAPWISGLLIGLIAASNLQIIASGNFAGPVVCLCVIAVWCFVRHRYLWLGTLCLALAIGIKPHDAIWVWLFFLLAGNEYRRLALKSIVFSAILCLPAFVWLWYIAPNWLSEMRYNIWAVAVPGGPCDPNLAASGLFSIGQLITLHPVFSYFWNNVTFYKSATIIVCTPLLLIWAWVTYRSRPSLAETWLGLASLLPLGMLPIYHRGCDAKLFLLMIPACALLWAEGERTGRNALWLTTATLLLTADIPWAVLQIWGNHQNFATGSWEQRILIIVWVFPVPLTLLLTGCFFLWMYARRTIGSYHRADNQNLVGKSFADRSTA